MSKTINQWFEEYGESHQNLTNKLFHFVCVPTIFFSLIGLLSLVSLPTMLGINIKTNSVFFSLASLIIILSFIFYLRLSFSIAIGMLFVSLISLWLNYLIFKMDIIPLWLFSVIIFALAWVGQFYGHNIEGKKPSFFKDLQFLLIGPAWILSFIYKKIGIKI
ncbi:MAG: hypothetical protein CO128_02060 [Ignavibacteriales bacterium CG_4_9_14_3_um_filter_30_11]|nr:MAG: hypothetical protein CO128_02060 [Ignavibacteriales bacterium CG_4_9_14_3_um_filter_30_11]